MNKLHNHIDEVKKTHWIKWLKDSTACNIYTANKYINSEPSDYSSTQIPDLKVPDNAMHQENIASDNTAKARALVSSFFPPPLTTPVIPASAYPEPLTAKGFLMKNNIRRTIRKLKPYKAPGVDGIQNIVLQECAEVLINNLYFIYHAVLELNAYPFKWLTILTIILHKPGKVAYNIVKAYRPIGLLDTLGKLFSSLIVADLSHLAEKHQLLPPTQFSGMPGRCTTDVIHLVVPKIKEAWRRKKVVSILFLNIQAAFPNTVKERLLHNMRTR